MRPGLLDYLRNRFGSRPNVLIRHLDLADVPVKELQELELDTVVCLNVLANSIILLQLFSAESLLTRGTIAMI